eukprot:10849433-Lingulodinium_polyedra.AAC.1
MVHWMRGLSVDCDEYFAIGRPTNLNEQCNEYLKPHEYCPVICPGATSDRAGHGLGFLKPILSASQVVPEGPKVDVKSTQVPVVTDPTRVVSEQNPRIIGARRRVRAVHPK